MTIKLATTNEHGKASTQRILDRALSASPVQCVVWMQTEDGQTEVLISDGTDRIKAIGGLTASAIEMWVSD